MFYLIYWLIRTHKHSHIKYANAYFCVHFFVDFHLNLSNLLSNAFRDLAVPRLFLCIFLHTWTLHCQLFISSYLLFHFLIAVWWPHSPFHQCPPLPGLVDWLMKIQWDQREKSLNTQYSHKSKVIIANSLQTQAITGGKVAQFCRYVCDPHRIR